MGKADRDFILAVVQIDSKAFQFVDPFLKADRDFVLAVVKVHVNALKYAGDKIQADAEIQQAANETYIRKLEGCSSQGAHELLADGPDSVKADRDCVLATVSKAGAALQCANVALKGDKEVVLAAVTNYGNALKFADNAIQADEEVQTRARETYIENLKGKDCRGAYKLLNDSPQAIREDNACVLATLQITGASMKLAGSRATERFRRDG